MIGIRAIASYVPPRRVSTSTPRRRRQGRGVHPRQARLRIAVAARPGHGNLRPVRAGVPRARSRPGFDPASVDCVIVCAEPRRARPAAPRPWSTASSGCRRRQLRHLAGLFRLRVRARGGDPPRSCRRNGLRSGLLFTADPYSKILDPQDWDTELLFGDAATVTWLAPDPVYRCRPAIFRIRRQHGPFDRGARARQTARDAGQQRVQVQHDRGAGAGAGLPRARTAVLRRHRPGPAAPGQPVHRRQPRPASSGCARTRRRSKRGNWATPCPRRCR